MSKLINIAAIGSGPAALYSAQYVLKHLAASASDLFKVNVDIYEKLPVPFGLVRYGVAPDHQDVKNVIHSFTETLKQDNVNFFGNVNIGTDLKISELLDAYNCVVLAYGSHGENYLNVPGEKDYTNLISAKSFVSWYNGLPPPESEKNFRINLSCKRAIIIGAGNVAIDIARILLSPTDKLSRTDISQGALEIIKKTNHVEHVSIVARRGILNAAFTLKELRELTKIQSLNCRLDLDQFGEINYAKTIDKLARPRKRITEFMYNMAKKASECPPTANQKTLELAFMRTPVEIVGDQNTKTAKGVKFQLNKYDVDFSSDKSSSLKLDNEKSLNSLSIVPRNDASIENRPGELVIRSIGYKNVNIDESIPFDKVKGVVPNDRGQVIGKDGLFCTGWIKRGPRGVIVDTTSDAYETAQKICTSLTTTNMSLLHTKQGAKQIADLLRSRNVKFVDKAGWLKIDSEEVRRGKLTGKPREKLSTIEEMLKVALD